MPKWGFLKIIPVICAFIPSASNAQPDTANLVVTFAAVPTLESPAAVAVVLRRRSGNQRNLVLLRSGQATVGQLALALGALAQRRSHSLEVVGSEERTVVAAGRFSTSNHELLTRISSILNELRVARPVNVEGIGIVPAIDVPIHLRTKDKPEGRRPL